MINVTWGVGGKLFSLGTPSSSVPFDLTLDLMRFDVILTCTLRNSALDHSELSNCFNGPIIFWVMHRRLMCVNMLTLICKYVTQFNPH